MEKILWIVLVCIGTCSFAQDKLDYMDVNWYSFNYPTPIAETEQFYPALKLNKAETAMVHTEEASHEIAGRPSNQINKAGYILGWFEKYRTSRP